MRSLCIFFKQVRFVQNTKNGLPRNFGELVIILERRVISSDHRTIIDAQAAGTGQQAARWHHFACAEYCRRHHRHLAFDRGSKSAGTKAANPGLLDERAFRKKGQGLAILCGLDELARVAGTARRSEAFDKSCACAS